MANLGFLGLGIMGYPMARNLIDAGHNVAIWSHSAGKAEKLASEKGGKAYATPAEVAANADCIFYCVGDSDMSSDLCHQLLEGAKPGTVIVDASTISPSDSRKLSEACKAKGVHFLDAPCTGSRPGAESGNLTFMVGGASLEAESFAQIVNYQRR